MSSQELIHHNCDLICKSDSFEDTSDYFTFIGHASTFGNLDLVNDRMERGAFIDSITKKLPKLLWQHNWEEPIGRIQEIREDQKGLFIKAILPKSIERAREVGIMLKEGIIDSLSIGFRIIEAEDERDVRVIKRVDLREISVVTFPANELATITGVKAIMPYQDSIQVADTDTEWNPKDAIERIKSLSKEDIQTAFLYRKGEDKSNVDSYDMPIMDVIDGALQVVPRALFDAVIFLQSNKSSELLETAKAEAIKTIEKYYEKMNIESPFGKPHMIGKYEVDQINTERDFEKFLIASAICSKQDAKTLASKFKPVKRDVENGDDVRDAITNSDIVSLLQSNFNEIMESIK